MTPLLPPLSAPAELIYAIGMAAVAVNAASAVLETEDKKMDLVGAVVVGLATSLGGGTLRDLLLDRRPFFWVLHSEYIWVVLALGVAGSLGLRAAHLSPSTRPMLLADALGLGLFSASGAGMAWEIGQPAIVCALMGVVTGVFGGVMRDVLCNEVPATFRDHRPYAICAFAGAWAFLAVASALGAGWQALVAGILVTAGLRIAALSRGWRVPGWAGERDEERPGD